MLDIPLNTESKLVFENQKLKSFYLPRSFARQIAHTVQSLIREIFTFIELAAYWVTFKTSNVENPIWKQNSQGLIVMLHGLHNSPIQWHRQIRLLKHAKNIDAFAPIILKRGDIEVDIAVKPILDRVVTYVRQHPGKPVCLLGISNGARLTTLIEWHLRKIAPRTPVKVSNISGVHFGSSLIDLGNRLMLTGFVVSPAVQNELAYGSAKAKEILSHVQEPFGWTTAPRDFEYYATTEDLAIPNLNSTLPKIGHPARYLVEHGHSHNSLVTTKAKYQINQCFKWMQKQQPHTKDRLAAYIFG